jgi:hypothetical protein
MVEANNINVLGAAATEFVVCHTALDWGRDKSEISRLTQPERYDDDLIEPIQNAGLV